VKRISFSLRIPINPRDGGLGLPSWAKCDQVTTLEKALLVYPPLGRLRGETLAAIEHGIKLALLFH
jgi:mRNA-degrading endonuclease toxin of MazEF toxin-antitoxin module